ncbi:type II toxin-antitoxin system VapC family toxin [Nonomuraea lactucae]|uniref:type II toxin-antitoxin system VapC family toxin n=1 Tax=Nonomuraea lactucae TaxID=2249762 RepID=UPI001F0630E3|nr:type II toxin-antitoxin system VapC family toxin [Nonomuraea lactucae]
MIDTCVYMDLADLSADALPALPEITSITLAELHQGVAMAKTAAVRAARLEKLGSAVGDFDPLPFDAGAAARYGSLVTLTLAAKRDPRPRRVDLMIAAIASSQGLPLYTCDTDDFVGLESLLTVVPVQVRRP